jgi:type I restriction enzyme S subunit
VSEWQKVKLNDVLKHRKGSIKIDDNTEYKLCRVQVRRRGVLLRGKQFGHEIKTKKQQVCQSGDLIVAEMDAKFGGYGFIPDELNGAIVSSHYYLYELDKDKISQDYFQTLISTDYIQNQIEAKGSTNYSSIRAKEFLEYEIPLASKELQAEISKRFLTFSSFNVNLNFGIVN